MYHGPFDKISDRNLRLMGQIIKKIEEICKFWWAILENMGQMAPWPPPELSLIYYLCFVCRCFVIYIFFVVIDFCKS